MDEKAKKNLFSGMTIIGILGFLLYIWGDLTHSFDKQTLHAIEHSSLGLALIGTFFNRWKSGMSHGTKVMLTIMTVFIIAAIIVAIVTALIGQPDPTLYKVNVGLILAGLCLACILLFKMEN